jgi:hypothetical protein
MNNGYEILLEYSKNNDAVFSPILHSCTVSLLLTSIFLLHQNFNLNKNSNKKIMIIIILMQRNISAIKNYFYNIERKKCT